MQGSKTTIINLNDSLNAFVEKLQLWKMHVMKDVFAMFDRLSSVTRANESINISAEVTEHLCKLEEELDRYFPERKDMDDNLQIVRNPINANFFSLPVHLQEEFIDLKNNSTMKTAFEYSELTTFWCNASASYPRVAKYMISKLLPFASTYLCEAAFSDLVAMKTKYRNTINVENDLICALSCIKPRISLLAKNKQSQASHEQLCYKWVIIKMLFFLIHIDKLFCVSYKYLFLADSGSRNFFKTKVGHDYKKVLRTTGLN